MEIILAPAASEDLEYWKRINNAAILKRIELLLADIAEHPFTGIGKPERLKFDLAGEWSRRINSEHRIVYKVTEQGIEVLVFSMRYYYNRGIHDKKTVDVRVDFCPPPITLKCSKKRKSATDVSD